MGLNRGLGEVTGKLFLLENCGQQSSLLSNGSDFASLEIIR